MSNLVHYFIKRNFLYYMVGTIIVAGIGGELMHIHGFGDVVWGGTCGISAAVLWVIREDR